MDSLEQRAKTGLEKILARFWYYLYLGEKTSI